MCGHHAITALADAGVDRLVTVAVEPVVVREVGRTQQRVALALGTMAGDADAVVQLLALGQALPVLALFVVLFRTVLGLPRSCVDSDST